MKKLLSILFIFALVNCGYEAENCPKDMENSIIDKVDLAQVKDMTVKPIDMKPYSRLEDYGDGHYFDHELLIKCRKFSIATSLNGSLYDICLPDNYIGSNYAFEDSKCTRPAKSTIADTTICVGEGGGGPVCLISSPILPIGNYAAGTNGWAWPVPILIKFSEIKTVYVDPSNNGTECLPKFRPIGIEKVDINILEKL